jgi:hypothetical protein
MVQSLFYFHWICQQLKTQYLTPKVIRSFLYHVRGQPCLFPFQNETKTCADSRCLVISFLVIDLSNEKNSRMKLTVHVVHRYFARKVYKIYLNTYLTLTRSIRNIIDISITF